jgi:hypothetical protein
MSSLSIQINDRGQKVISRDGRLMCSPRDPEKEAQSWMERQKIKASDSSVLVLGLGAAYHIHELRAQFPQLKIDVLELNSDTSLALQDQFTGQNTVTLYSSADELEQKQYDHILCFRPAWIQYESSYLEYFLRLTQKSDEAFLRAVRSEELPATASVLEKRSIPFTLKDLNFIEADGADPEIKLWRCLRELVE